MGETKLNRIFSAELNDRGLAVVPEVLSELPMLKCLNLAFNGIRDLAPLKVNKVRASSSSSSSSPPPPSTLATAWGVSTSCVS